MASINRAESTASSVASDTQLSENDCSVATTLKGIQDAVISPSESGHSNVLLCVVGQAAENNELLQALQKIGMDYVTSSDGLDYIDQADVAYVLNDFSDHMRCFSEDPDVLAQLKRHRIFGPTAIIEAAKLDKGLPDNRRDSARNVRPLFCASMRHVTVCISGYGGQRELENLAQMIRWMGGRVASGIKDYHKSLTHMVCRVARGLSYRLAVGFGIKIMDPKWVYWMWEHRHIPFFKPSPEDIAALKLKSFTGLKLCFVGVDDEEELAEMTRQAIDQAAEVVSDPVFCDRLVVDVSRSGLSFDIDMLPLLSNRTKMVTTEWFWVSIQYETCASEDLFPIQRPEDGPSLAQKPLRLLQRVGHRRHSHGSGMRKTETSLSAGSLDISTSEMSSVMGDHVLSSDDIEALVRSPRRNISKRQQVCFELLQTESNYVQILKTIITIFMEPLERMISTDECPLVDEIDMKGIFSNIPKIYDVHTEILRELTNMIAHWNEDRLIGKVWADNEPGLKDVYPPFVNFFEKSKETLQSCMRKNNRFFAFIKACESKPECGRQSLQELLIRPVQRLPSVQLLLSDLHEKTVKADKSNPDRFALAQALEAVKRVLTHINEAKRKTEAVVELFSLSDQIENRPPYLLSAQREMLGYLKVHERSNMLGGNPNKKPILLYLFNDCLEIVKLRERKRKNKHLMLISLSNIRRILDVGDDQSISDSFYLVTRGNDDTRESRILFEHIPTSETISKTEFLQLLCRAVANFLGSAHKEDELLTADAPLDENDISTNDILNTTFRGVLSNTGRRMGRAFSFTKTPRSGGLKRALSNMSLAMGNMGGTLKRMSRSNLRLPDVPGTPPGSTQKHRATRLLSIQSVASESSYHCLSPVIEPCSPSSTSTPISRSRAATAYGLEMG